MTAADRSARGFVRVRVLLEGVEIGSAFFDAEGRIQDALPTRQARREDDVIVQALLDSVLELAKVREQTLDRDLKLGENSPVNASFRRMFEKAGMTVFGDSAVNVRGFVQYLGLKRLEGVRTAGFRTELLAQDTPIQMRHKTASSLLRINELHVDGVEYFDPDKGHLLASYVTTTMAFTVAPKSSLMRFSCRKTLDKKQSRGIDSDEGSPEHREARPTTTTAINRDFLPLPVDVRIVPPGSDANRELAAFSGQWLGTWEGIPNKHTLVVESVQGAEAVVVFAATGKDKPVASRGRAIFVDGTLKLLAPSGSITYQMQNDGTVLAIMRADTRTFLSRMTRVGR